MQFIYRLGKIIVQPFFKLLYPTKFLGLSRKKFISPAIMTANHYSALDPLVLVVNHPRQIHFLSKKELWSNKFNAWLFDRIGMIPVDRGKADIGAIKATISKLKAKKTIGLFPEGTRNREGGEGKHIGSMLKISAGATMFAIKSRTPIVPMIFWRKVKIFRRNLVICGDPLYLKDFYYERLNTESLRNANKVLAARMSEIKQIMEYFKTQKGKNRKEMIKELKDYRMPFSEIYKKYYAYLDHTIQVVTDDEE